MQNKLVAMFASLIVTIYSTLVMAGVASIAHHKPMKFLMNPGFEGGYRILSKDQFADKHSSSITGRLADHWQDNSAWSGATISYGRDTTNPHSGRSDQRIAAARGVVQFVQSVNIKKSGVYQFSVWMRGRQGMVASLDLRQSGTPYHRYVSREITLSSEWREYHVRGNLPAGASIFVMIRATAVPTTFFVDDAQFVNISDKLARQSPPAGNLITGGSFEAGWSFGWSSRFTGLPQYDFDQLHPVIDNTTAAVGQRSVCVDIPEQEQVVIRSPRLMTLPGRTYTISVWLKSSENHTPVRISLRNTGISRTVNVGKHWKRYIVTGVAKYQPSTWLAFHTSAHAKLWLDGAQVVAGKAPPTDYLSVYPNQLTLSWRGRPGHIVFDHETARAEVGLGGTLPKGAKLRLSVVDLYGHRKNLPDVTLPVSSIVLSSTVPHAQGVFKLIGTITDAHGRALSAPVALVWARLPRPRSVKPDHSFFGLHIPLAPDDIQLAKAVGVKWIRLHDASIITRWAAVEPKPGQWRFYDRGVDAAHRAGLAILGMLDGAPAWISKKPRATSGYWSYYNLPDKAGALEAWRKYVEKVVSHYQGDINHWEVWNEPWGRRFLTIGGTPELYARLLKIAYQTAKQISLAQTIVGVDTSWNSARSWTVPVLQQAGTKWFDAFSFHQYNNASGAMDHAEQYRALQAQYGEPKPLWDTEGGPGNIASFYDSQTGGLPLRQQLSWIVHYDVLQMAGGVRRFFLYTVRTGSPIGATFCDTTEYDGAIKPILAAQAVLAHLVDGLGTPKQSQPAAGVVVFTYPASQGKTVAVVWSTDGKTHSFPVAAGQVALDILGNPLIVRNGYISVTGEPVYVMTR